MTRNPHLAECLYAGEYMTEHVFVAACRELVGEVLDHRSITRAASANRVMFEGHPENVETVDWRSARWRVRTEAWDAWADVLRALDAEQRLGEQPRDAFHGLRWDPEQA
ncbi:hypothetical protein LCGC14_0750130 [marine sediment metagenome]|uniref:Uncharacterized protein n=1 Tax=marine sediment metagenome TaxID=412755 RepID=A0A0F9Q463_9ZZZZ